MGIMILAHHVLSIYHALMSKALRHPHVNAVQFVTPGGVTGIIDPSISLETIQALKARIGQRIEARRQAQAAQAQQHKADPTQN